MGKRCFRARRNEYIGSRITQAGINFDGFQGSVAVGGGDFYGGDFNEDGDVDGDDLLLWESGFGTASGAGHGDGDADSDFDVDGRDFLIWQSQFGLSLPPGSGSARIAPVPEPKGFTLLSLALGLVAATRSTRKT